MSYQWLKVSGSSKQFSTVVRSWMTAFLIIAAVFAGQVWADKDKDHGDQSERSSTNAGVPSVPVASQDGSHGMMDGMEMEMNNPDMPFFERLYTWFGRLHPPIVHFPIAFFPAALFTVIVGRRRPEFAAPVQFLVVAGALFASVAAATGWLAGMSADAEPTLVYHSG